MISKEKIFKIFKEIIVMSLVLFTITNVMSYIRKPTLDNTTFPQNSFTLIDGTTYTPERGKPLLIHFWATWCKVCSVEASNIEYLSKKYEVLTIAVQSGSIEEIKASMTKDNVHFRVVSDSEGILATQYKISAYPTDVIYNAEGKLHSIDVGYTSTLGLLTRMKLAE